MPLLGKNNSCFATSNATTRNIHLLWIFNRRKVKFTLVSNHWVHQATFCATLKAPNAIVNVLIKARLGFIRKLRICQRSTCHSNHIRFTTSQYFFCNKRVVNTTYTNNRNMQYFLHLSSIIYISCFWFTGCWRNNMVEISSLRYMQHINTGIFKKHRDGFGFFNINRSRDAFFTRNTVLNKKIFSHFLTHTFDDIYRKFRPATNAAAIFITTLVRKRRIKTM